METIEVSERTKQRLEKHRREEQSTDDLIEILLDIYEEDSTFVQQGP